MNIYSIKKYAPEPDRGTEPIEQSLVALPNFGEATQYVQNFYGHDVHFVRHDPTNQRARFKVTTDEDLDYIFELAREE